VSPLLTLVKLTRVMAGVIHLRRYQPNTTLIIGYYLEKDRVHQTNQISDDLTDDIQGLTDKDHGRQISKIRTDCCGGWRRNQNKKQHSCKICSIVLCVYYYPILPCMDKIRCLPQIIDGKIR
jgi:hypothetical protein